MKVEMAAVVQGRQVFGKTGSSIANKRHEDSSSSTTINVTSDSASTEFLDLTDQESIALELNIRLE